MECSRAWRSLAGCGRMLLAALLAGVILSPLAWANEKEMEEGSLAAAIRDAGHPCDHVTGMERSQEGAAEGFIVWVVHCNSGEYRVIFKGDTGSEVVPLD
jgi:hypothetical protein